MTDPLAKALLLLPHGPEFRFLDRLLTLDPGVRGEAEFTVRGDQPFLRGHFPANPILPGVLLVEAAAQLVGVVAQSDPLSAPLRDLRLTAIRAAKILGAVRPKETVHLSAEVTGRLGHLVQGRVRATLNGAPVFQCEITLAGG